MTATTPLWEVFIRPRNGLAHKHVGSVHAADAELALSAARDVYTRRGEGVSIWVVPSAEITASDPSAKDETFEPTASKIYRHPTSTTSPTTSGTCEARGMPYSPEAALDGPTVSVPAPPDYPPALRAALMEWCVRTGDDALILGHRLSEWCGHAPMLEEDLALPNMALDLIGQARILYAYAGALEGKGRDEDAFAYLREEREFHNVRLVARPNGDFAHTMLRQLHFAAFAEPMWRAAEASADPVVSGLAAKARKEMAYHVRHSAEWVIRLGDGTEESARRMAEAVAALAPFAPELFETDAVTETLAAEGLAPDPAALRPAYEATMASVFAEALLTAPEIPHPQTGGRRGFQGEELGHLLAEMQSLARAHPGATW